LTLIATIIPYCTQTDNKTSQDDWIKGTEEEKFKTIEKHFRGFDDAMVETGYRYQELYWAGQDENWDYAIYQLEKLEIAIENGLERRPKRAKSAEHFLNYVLPEMQKSLESKDMAAFNKNFQMLRTECKNCHVNEGVPFIQSVIPEERLSPIKFQKNK